MPTRRKYDHNGWYEVDENPIARSGILEYLGASISPSLVPDKIYRVWRPDEELDNPDTLKSFSLIPWFSRHEMAGDGATDAERIGIQGITGETPRFDQQTKTLVSKIKAIGSSLMGAIEGGIKQLSIGMKCDWIIESGITPDGEPYDVRQINIRGNHLASVPEGRAGSAVAVMDSSDMITFAMDELNFKKTDSNEENVMDVKAIKAAIAALSPEDQEALLAGMKPKAEDAPEEEEPKEDDKTEDAPKGAMDAAALSDLFDQKLKPLTERLAQLEGSAMDENAIIKSINEKNALVSKITPIVGAFDHAEMSKQQVAEYALKHEKIKIACDSGTELATLNGFLHSYKQPKFTVDNGAMDSSERKPSKSLEEMGAL